MTESTASDLQERLNQLQAENDELRQQRRMLLQMLYPANDAETFDPKDYTIVTLEDILADLKTIDQEKQAG